MKPGNRPAFLLHRGAGDGECRCDRFFGGTAAFKVCTDAIMYLTYVFPIPFLRSLGSVDDEHTVYELHELGVYQQ